MTLLTVVLLFIGYIVVHYYLIQYVKQESEKNYTDESKLKELKTIKILTKWFPAIYVIFSIIVLYTGG